MSPFLAQLQEFFDARLAAGESVVMLLVDCGVIARMDVTWGYQVGDAAHEFLAARLRADALRDQDFLVAASRDEFVCALSTVSDTGVALLAAEKLLRSLDTPVWAGEDEIYADAAVGIAMPSGGEEDAAAQLGRATAACRLARGRAERVAVYSAEETGPDAEQLPAISRLRAAVLHESFEFLFRPQLDVRTGMIVGAECMLGGAAGVVPVREAIAAVRGARRVDEATRWVVSAVLRHCAELRQGCGLDLRVGINLSAKDLHLLELTESIAGLLKVWNLRPSRLTVGISDSFVLAQRPEARELLNSLGAAGVRLGLDDQVAGLSVLAQLETLPFAELRLEISLLGDLVGSPRRQAIARSLIEIAHQSRMEVLADGVADVATAECLKGLGCDILQGEHVGSLVSAPAFIGTHQQ